MSAFAVRFLSPSMPLPVPKVRGLVGLRRLCRSLNTGCDGRKAESYLHNALRGEKEQLSTAFVSLADGSRCKAFQKHSVKAEKT